MVRCACIVLFFVCWLRANCSDEVTASESRCAYARRMWQCHLFDDRQRQHRRSIHSCFNEITGTTAYNHVKCELTCPTAFCRSLLVIDFATMAIMRKLRTAVSQKEKENNASDWADQMKRQATRTTAENKLTRKEENYARVLFPRPDYAKCDKKKCENHARK